MQHSENTVQCFDDARQKLPKGNPFTFDAVLGPQSTQDEVFEVVRPVVDGVMEGYNGTIFAYGQTSSGKTHTIQGADIFDPQHAGVVPRAVHAIFDAVARSPPCMAFTLKVSAMEIYMERIRDLLAPSANNLPIRQDDVRGIFVEGVQEEYVASPAEVMGIYAEAVANRAVAATGMNSGSSRSHAVTTITIEARDTQTLDGCRVGKLNIVDLAGSESLRRSEATGQTAAETMTINRSLSALGNVINALTSGGAGGGAAPSSGSSVASALGGRRTPASPRDTNASPAPLVGGDRGEAWERGSVASATTAASRRLRGGGTRHIPYRDSKLTRLLQDALGGNARTVLIVCVSPTRINLAESMSTLRFGERAKRIKNKATVNKIRTTEEMQRLLTKAETAIDAQNLLIQALQQQVMVLKSAASPRRHRQSARSHGSHSYASGSSSGSGSASGSDSDSGSDSGGSSSTSALSGGRAATGQAQQQAVGGSGRRGSSAAGGGAGASDDAAEVVLLRKEVARLRQELKDSRSDLRERSVEMQSLSASLAQADSVSSQLRAQLQAARAAAQGGASSTHGSVRGVRGMERALVADAAAASKEAAHAKEDAAAAWEQVQQLQHLLDRTRAAAASEARKLLDRLQAARDTSAASGWVDEADDDSTASDGAHHAKAAKELQAQLQTAVMSHRQLHRKYAMVEQDLASATAAIASRDARIRALQASTAGTALELRQLHTSLAEQASLLAQLRGSQAAGAAGSSTVEAATPQDGAKHAAPGERTRRISAFASPSSIHSDLSLQTGGHDAAEQTSPSFSRVIVRSVRGGTAGGQWNGSLDQADDSDGGSSQDGAENLLLM